MSRATCSWAAAATLGWQWPVLVTPIPAVKSRYSRPWMSVSTAPRPVATWTAVACLRIGDSVAGIEAPLHRACDGAAWWAAPRFPDRLIGGFYAAVCRFKYPL